jgi:plasmid stabilization system protein ParE
VRQVRWSAHGLALYQREVIGYLEEQDEAAARQVNADAQRTIAVLAQRPIGRPGRISGTYEKTVVGRPYIIAYSLLPRDDGRPDDILILRIIHTARDWPPGRWPR